MLTDNLLEARQPYKTFDDLDDYTNTKQIQETCLHIPIKTAADEWLNTFENSESRRKNNIGLQRLFNNKEKLFGIDFNTSILCLDRTRTTRLYEYILKEYPKEGNSVRRLMATGFSRLTAFTAGKTRGIIQPSLRPIERSAYEKTLAIYSEIEWPHLISTLRKPFDRAAKMVYLAGKSGYRLGVNNPELSFLTLKTSQIDFDTNRIYFNADQVHGYFGFILECSPTILSTFQNKPAKSYVFTGVNSMQKLSLRSLNRVLLRHSSDLCGINITISMLSYAGIIRFEKQVQKSIASRLLKLKPSVYSTEFMRKRALSI